ncbi:MFS transporter [Cupriavidus gilardii]|uniref:MFS transporter n=1 Tax=Cupriavidus gilardii TaxID=82541 RepID=UPI0020C61A09|nr:MFS transporter [Cupriavidus gilardii]
MSECVNGRPAWSAGKGQGEAASVPAPAGKAAMWLTVAVVVGAGVVAALQIGKAAIATPMLQADLGASLAQAGWLMAIVAVLGSLGGIPAGALVPAFGDRRVLLGGLLTVVAGACAGALAQTLTALMASRFVEGLGFLLIAVAGPAVLQRVVPLRQRDIAFSLWSCFMPAGMALAMIVGPLFDEWRGLWWGSAAIAVVAMAAARLAIPAEAQRQASSEPSLKSPSPSPSLSHGAVAIAAGMRADIAAVLRERQPLRLAACFALYSLMFFALFSFLPVLLIERIGASHRMAGLLTALAIGANMIGNLAAGYLLARGVSRPVLVASTGLTMGLAALGIFLSLFGDVPTFLLCLVFSAVGGLIPAALLASGPIVAPTSALVPVVIGLLMQGSNLGQVVGPITVGAAIEAYGWPAAAAIVALSALGAMLLARGMRFSRDSSP